MRVLVNAKPRAKEEKVEKVGEGRFVVSVKEPPVKGMANAAIAQALADYFGVGLSSVRLISGFSSKQKAFEINI